MGRARVVLVRPSARWSAAFVAASPAIARRFASPGGSAFAAKATRPATSRSRAGGVITSAGRSWPFVRDSVQAMTRPFQRPDVARAFRAYPAPMRRRLMRLRQLIFETAAGLD